MNIVLHLLLIFAVSIAVVVYALKAEKPELAAVPAVIMVFYVRLAPKLNPLLQWWHDHHYYLFVTKPVIKGGTLLASSEYVDLYPLIQRQLKWPGLYLLSGEVVIASGAPMDDLLTFMPAMLGVITFLVAWYLFYQLIGPRWSLIAAYAYSMMDLVVFYQTEFHAQGAGILLGTLFLSVYLKYQQDKREKRTIILLLLAGVGLVMSHHLTSLAILVVCFFYLVGGTFLQYISQDRFGLPVSLSDVEVLLPVGICVIVVFIIPPTIILSTSISELLLLLFSTIPESTKYNPRAPVPGYEPTLLRELVTQSSLFVKVFLGGIASFTIAHGFRQDEALANRTLAVLLGAVGLTTIAITPLITVAITRMTIFGYLPLIGLLMMFLQRFVTSSVQWLPSAPSRTLIVAVVISTLVIVTLLSAYAPSMVDPSSDIAPDSYHEIKPVDEQQAVTSSQWVGHYTTSSAETYYFNGKLRGVLFYYAPVPLNEILYVGYQQGPGYYYLDSMRQYPADSRDRVYANGRIVIERSDAKG